MNAECGEAVFVCTPLAGASVMKFSLRDMFPWTGQSTFGLLMLIV